MTSWLWAIFTVVAAGSQTLRNAMQKELTATLGTVGATHVRFLYGLPFGLLFLSLVLLATGKPVPAISGEALRWTLAGALAQIAATALLLAAMREKSFVLVTALTKTEPVYVALFGLAVLGDRLTPGLALAIGLATAGVMIMSWPKAGATALLSWRPVILGLIAGAVFAVAAIGFRGGILALDHERAGAQSVQFVVNASTILALGLAIQTVLLSGYLALFERANLIAIFRAWRPSIRAGFMGAFASQMWFLAFAIESAAKVRTLALVEIFFAGLVSRSLFKQGLASREGLGIGLIVIGVGLLLNL